MRGYVLFGGVGVFLALFERVGGLPHVFDETQLTFLFAFSDEIEVVFEGGLFFIFQGDSFTIFFGMLFLLFPFFWTFLLVASLTQKPPMGVFVVVDIHQDIL